MIKKNISDYDVVITKNDKINEHYFLLGVSKPVNFQAKSGQFVNIKIEPESLEPFLRRPFSIFYLDQYEIGILYQIKGEGTKILSSKRIGSKLKMIGPAGTNFPLSVNELKDVDSIILVAGGIGIAPLFYYSRILKEEHENLDIILVYGIKDETYLLPEDYMKFYFSSVFIGLENKIFYNENLYTGCNCKVVKGNAIEILNCEQFNENLNKLRKPLFAVCGPDAMLKAFVKWNSSKSYSSYLSLESFMGCGFHACLGCAVSKSSGGYLYLCEEGPVVNYTDIIL